MNHNFTLRRLHWGGQGLLLMRRRLLLLLLCVASPGALAQTSAPTPASSGEAGQLDALTQLVLVAGQLLPRVQAAVERPLMPGLESLAFSLAVIVMLFSFARLLRENDGAGKEFFWWCLRLAAVFLLFGQGRAILTLWQQLGVDIVNVTEFRQVLWDAELEFNVNYTRFIEGAFLVAATDPNEALAALTTDDLNLRNITNAANPAAWSLPKLFFGLTLGRLVLQFAQVFLALLSALLLLALRLFAPFAIAVAVDRGLAQRISYPFAWSAAVFTMITPLVSHVLSFLVYQTGTLALSIIKPESRLFQLGADGALTGDPQVVGPATAACVLLIVWLLLGALLLLASPYLSYN
jgi:hypothetical protein